MTSTFYSSDQEDLRAEQHARQKQSYRERLNHLPIGLDPPEILLVDPKLAFDFENISPYLLRA
jgi:hypothetical protein